jgi:hypothetical protein
MATTTSSRPTCSVKGCVRLVMMRDRTGDRIRWRRRCYVHHRLGVTARVPPPRPRLTDGLVCSTRGCGRAPEAFVRPDGRVYIRPVCRICRRARVPTAATKRAPSPRQPVAPNVPLPASLTAEHRRWQDTPLKRNSKRFKQFPTIMVKGGVWVKDDDLGWFVPDSQAKAIIRADKSSYTLAKEFGLPSRVVVTLQSNASRGRLTTK